MIFILFRLEVLWIILNFILINITLIGCFFTIIFFIHLKLKSKNKSKKNLKTITFVHPNCTDCGGGEKVLWYMIHTMLSDAMEYGINKYFTGQIYVKIITARNQESNLIKQKLQDIFNINFFNERYSSVINSIELVRIKNDFLLKPQNFATMLFQILGQIIFAFEILLNCFSDIYIDTTGLPFIYFILKYLGQAKLNSYIHYPFISVDMINDIKNNTFGVHSRGIISKIQFLNQLKVFYYNLILDLYKFNCEQLSYAQCNSTWTFNHMKQILKNVKLSLLYPPCNTSKFCEIAKNRDRKNLIVSFGQFRPEKNHRLQVRIMEDLFKRGKVPQNLELHIIGGCRDIKDEEFANSLQNEINEKGLMNNIKLIKNAPFNLLLEEFKIAKIGIHTMKDEHFGISIIEMMASGMIVIAHKSAGAKLDIIDKALNIVGFTVVKDEDYAPQIEMIINNCVDINQISLDAVTWAQTFGEESFKNKFCSDFNEMI